MRMTIKQSNPIKAPKASASDARSSPLQPSVSARAHPDRQAHPVSLVNTADNVSDKRRKRGRRGYRRRRGKRYAARAALRRVTRQDRLRACGARPVSRDGVLLRTNTHGHAHYAGVQTCGSPWICPVCGPKIRQQRASEIVLAVEAHLAEGGQLYTSMFTFPHPDARAGHILPAFDASLSVRIKDTLREMGPWWVRDGPIVTPQWSRAVPLYLCGATASVSETRGHFVKWVHGGLP